MFDTKSMENRFGMAKKMNMGKGGNSGPRGFEKLPVLDIDVGTTLIVRLPPRMADKCPQGYWPKLNHYVVKKQGQDEPKEWVVCERTGDFNNSCLLCDVLETLSGMAGDIPDSVHKAVEQSCSQGKILLPITGFIEEYNSETKENRFGREYKVAKYRAANHKDPKNEKSWALEFKAGPNYTTEFFTQQLTKVKVEDTYEDEQGQYFRFRRADRFNFTLDPTGVRIPMANQKLLQDFPNYPSFSKDNRMDEFAMQQLLTSCWWWPAVKHLIEFEEQDVTDYKKQMEPSRGLADEDDSLGLDDIDF